MNSCTSIQEQLSLSEDLSEEQRAHVSDCEACSETAAATRTLSAALRLTPAVPVGFATRLRARAHARIAQRRRRRAGLAIAGAAVAAAILLVVVRTGPSSQTTTSPSAAAHMDAEQPIEDVDDPIADAPSASDEDRRFAAELAVLANVEDSLHWSADWNDYERPIAGVSVIAWELNE
jgi:hypothetical protein